MQSVLLGKPLGHDVLAGHHGHSEHCGHGFRGAGGLGGQQAVDQVVEQPRQGQVEHLRLRVEGVLLGPQLPLKQVVQDHLVGVQVPDLPHDVRLLEEVQQLLLLELKILAEPRGGVAVVVHRDLEPVVVLKRVLP